MAKKLKINCGTLDTRNLAEETLAAYESIAVNCGTVVVTPESQTLLSRYGVTMSCGSTLNLPKDVMLQQINGSHKISPTDVVPGRCYLSVNGALEIAPGSQKVLESYVGMEINGSLLCPESLGGCLQNVSVNGSTTLYPDNAIVLKRTAVIDRLFALRAKEKLYWSAKRMILVDPKLDGAKLAEKGARFQSKDVILAESLVDSLIDHIDEQADILIVPDGTAVICDDVTLSATTVRKHGTKLYVVGSLKIGSDAREALAQLTYLKVRGSVTVSTDLEALLLEKADIDGKVVVEDLFLGRLIEDKNSLRISNWLLEKEEHGILAQDCAIVTIDQDVSNELIAQKLRLVDCGVVRCSQEQEAALALVCEDCGSIGAGEGDLLQNLGLVPDPNTVTINAGDYVF